MKQLLLELWYKYKVRSLRFAIAKLTDARRKINAKQKKLTTSVDEYVELHKQSSKL